jgi:hypothetical protein
MLFLLLAPLAQGAEVILDEAVVEATRAKLTEMRQEMIRLEDRFYERYNELNGNDDFDIHCALETRPGTRLKGRHCRPVFEAGAVETEARDYLQQLPSVNDPTPKPEAPPVPAIMAIEARRPDFRKNMVELTRKDRELFRLLRERDKVARKYEATRRKVFGMKPPPDEQEEPAAAATAP